MENLIVVNSFPYCQRTSREFQLLIYMATIVKMIETAPHETIIVCGDEECGARKWNEEV